MSAYQNAIGSVARSATDFPEQASSAADRRDVECARPDRAG